MFKFSYQRIFRDLKRKDNMPPLEKDTKIGFLGESDQWQVTFNDPCSPTLLIVYVFGVFQSRRQVAFSSQNRYTKKPRQAVKSAFHGCCVCFCLQKNLYWIHREGRGMMSIHIHTCIYHDLHNMLIYSYIFIYLYIYYIYIFFNLKKGVGRPEKADGYS
jgi:hypothetical protein